MRPLNYMEIRTLVRSGTIGIDLNIDIFKHPLYSQISIVELDHSLKERAFEDCFNKVSDLSFNPNYRDELNSKTDIKVHALLRPNANYISTRDLTGFQLYWTRFLNFLAHRSKIKVAPSATVVVPLVINILEGRDLPKMSLTLDDRLTKKGLICTSVIAGVTDANNTHVVLHNTSNKTLYIDDLSYLGNLRLLSN